MNPGMHAPAVMRVLVADTHVLFSEALKLVLEAEDDIEIVAQTDDPENAVVLTERHRPDVALIDAQLSLPRGEPVAAVLKQRFPPCRVIVLAERSDDDDALMEAVDAGADGFITKGRSMEELVEAMRRAWKGEVVIPSDMLGGLLARLTRRNKKQEEALEKVARLTPREREVLALLLEGADNEAIARELVISPETARTHVQNLMSKLGAHSRLEAVAFAMQSGIRSILLEGRSSRGR